ncbi:MAG: hypothetical protein AB7U20_00325 [Planctomycetaceae bacterium]
MDAKTDVTLVAVQLLVLETVDRRVAVCFDDQTVIAKAGLLR